MPHSRRRPMDPPSCRSLAWELHPQLSPNRSRQAQNRQCDRPLRSQRQLTKTINRHPVPRAPASQTSNWRDRLAYSAEFSRASLAAATAISQHTARICGAAAFRGSGNAFHSTHDWIFSYRPKRRSRSGRVRKGTRVPDANCSRHRAWRQPEQIEASD
jgi:hypothetical protein